MSSENVASTMGARLFIGTQTAASNQTQFEADTYIEVGEITDFGGDFGVSFNANEFTPVATGETAVKKGVISYGTLQLQLGRDVKDTGQAALKAAAENKSSIPYNVKIILNDEPAAGADPEPTTFYLRGPVMSYKTAIGNASANVTATAEIRVTQKPVEIPWAVGT